MKLNAIITLGIILCSAQVGIRAQSMPQSQNDKAQAEKEVPSRTRVYVTDSQSWEMRGGWAESGSADRHGASFAGSGSEEGGARPQTAEIIKTFGDRCPEVTVTNNKERANYVILLDHEGGKGYLRKDNKIAVFSRDGDALYSHSTATLGNAVKDACSAIMKDARDVARASN